MIPSAGQKATMLYEMPGGIFRRAKVQVSSEGLLNHKDNWFHDNQENCVFPIEPPIFLSKYEDLASPPERPRPGIPSGYLVIGEDNGWLPYSTKVILDWEDVENRQYRRQEYQEVGRQNAELRNIKNSLGNPLLTTFAVMGAIITGVMVMIIATALLLFQFGGEESGNGGAATSGALLLLPLMGLLSLKKKKAAQSADTESPEPPLRTPKVKEPLWTVYLYNTVTGVKRPYALPFSEIYEHISPAAWRYPILTMWRWYGAGLGALAVFLLFTVMVKLAPETLVLAFLLGIPMALGMASLGFWAGPKIAPKLSWYNRPYAKVRLYRTEDGETLLEPMMYTGLTGVEPAQWEFMVRQHLADIREEAAKQGIEEVPQFDPIVNRADDAYEDILGRLEREDTYIPMSTQQKIQLGSVVVIAAGSVATAFFVVMATVGA